MFRLFDKRIAYFILTAMAGEYSKVPKVLSLNSQDFIQCMVKNQTRSLESWFVALAIPLNFLLQTVVFQSRGPKIKHHIGLKETLHTCPLSSWAGFYRSSLGKAVYGDRYWIRYHYTVIVMHVAVATLLLLMKVNVHTDLSNFRQRHNHSFLWERTV